VSNAGTKWIHAHIAAAFRKLPCFHSSFFLKIRFPALMIAYIHHAATAILVILHTCSGFAFGNHFIKTLFNRHTTHHVLYAVSGFTFSYVRTDVVYLHQRVCIHL
jgi:hypothetical protein